MKVHMPADLAELYQTGKSKIYRDIERSPELYSGFVRAVQIMNKADNSSVLKGYSFLHYEKLKHNYSGVSSVRLSNRFVHRLLFTEQDDGIEIKLITIDDTLYGNR